MNIAEARLWLDGIVPGELTDQPFHAPEQFRTVTADLGEISTGEHEFLASTLDFSSVDTGLVSEGQSVRSELLTVARANPSVMSAVVDAAGRIVSGALGAFPAQPGTLIPGVTAAAQATLGEDPELTVVHGVFVVPYVWGENVPHFNEPEQLTMMLQLLMLTQDEFDYAVTYGVPALQEELVNEGIDINNWRR